MKRAFLPLCLVVIAVVAIVLTGRQAATTEVPDLSAVSEAAFDVRRTGSENATSFLVGNFTTEKGEKFCFSGKGEVKRIGLNLSSVTGQYVLLQSDSGAAVLQLELDGTERLYAFRLASPEGNFTLTDAEGITTAFAPVP